MKRRVWWMAGLAFALSLKPVQAASWKSVEKILGREGTEQEGSFLVSFPRSDLNVVVKGVPLEPELALTSWFTFAPREKEAQVWGELVVLDPEMPKVLAQLVRQGFEVESLYSPLLNESPHVKTLRVARQGSRSDLAQGLKAVLSTTGTPLEIPVPPTPGPPPPAPPAPTTGRSSHPPPTWAAVEKILGPGISSGKLSRYVFGRSSTAEGDKGKGSETYFNLQKDGRQVAATGAFYLTAGEVRGVVEVLTRNQLTVTALHHDRLEGTPQFFVLHFWALGDAGDVALGLQAALEKVPALSPGSK